MTILTFFFLQKFTPFLQLHTLIPSPSSFRNHNYKLCLNEIEWMKKEKKKGRVFYFSLLFEETVRQENDVLWLEMLKKNWNESLKMSLVVLSNYHSLSLTLSPSLNFSFFADSEKYFKYKHYYIRLQNNQIFASNSLPFQTFIFVLPFHSIPISLWVNWEWICWCKWERESNELSTIEIFGQIVAMTKSWLIFHLQDWFGGTIILTTFYDDNDDDHLITLFERCDGYIHKIFFLTFWQFRSHSLIFLFPNFRTFSQGVPN